MKTITIAGIALGLALTAFSASGASAAAACGDGSGQAATGEPIIIGAITGKTGPDDFSNSTKAAKAYFDCLNANGGIKGRPVEYRIEDDQWSPEIAAQLATKLVVDEKAVMLVGGASFVECGANAALYEKEGIIDLIAVGVPRECFFAKNIAATNAGPRVSMLGAIGYGLETLGVKSVVCIVPNIPNVGTWSCDGVAQLAGELGFKAETILIDPASADATSILLQAAASNPDAIIFGLPKNVTLPFLTAAEEQGMIEKYKWLSAASAYDLSVPGILGDAWKGHFYANMEFNDLESTTTDNANWLAVMDEYGQADDPRDTFSQAGYLAARVAEQALNAIDGDITREAATAALSAIKGAQSDIWCKPWYYGADATRHNANSSTRMAVADGEKWKVVSECAPSPDPELADLRAYEKSAGL